MSKLNHYLSRALCGVLSLMMIVSGTAAASFAAGAESTGASAASETTAKAGEKTAPKTSIAEGLKKTETVYVIAKADGTPEKVIVSDWIQNAGKAKTIEDKSNLTDIKNVKGEESYTINEDNSLTWAADGNDIYYQGTGKTELPVGVSVTYKLDGKTVAPEDIEGKSGKVTIRFDYTNRQYITEKIGGKEEKIYVPFAMLTGMLLDNEDFSNVEVKNGKVVNDGSRTYVAGFAFPGMQESLGIDKEDFELPSDVEVTAETEHFSLATTLTIATADLFGDVDTDKLDDKTDELSEKLDEFSDAVAKLSDGTSELYKGIGTLLSKTGELVEGVNKLYDGSSALAQGADSLNDGAVKLRDGIGSLDGGADSLKNGAARLDSGMSDLNSGAGDLDSGVAKLQGYLQQLTGGLGTISGNSDSLRAGAKQVFTVLLSTADKQIAAAGLEAPALTIDNYGAVLDKLIGSLGDDGVSQLAETKVREAVTATVESQRDVIRQAVEGAVRNQVTEGVLAAAGLGMSMEQYEASVAAGQIPEDVRAQISAGVAAQMSGMDSVVEANTEAKIAELIEQNMQGEQVQSQIAEALAKAQAGRESLAALKAQLDSFNEFYSGVNGYTDGVDSAYLAAYKIYAGTDALKDGTDSLKGGASQLKDGTGELKNGAVTLKDGSSQLKSGADQLAQGASALSSGAVTLKDGLGQLKDGTSALVDGVRQLNDGAMQLDEGMKKFKTEGVDKLRDLADNDIKNTLDRFKAMKKAADGYRSFSGISDGTQGKVDFIFKTEGIGE